MVLPIWPVVKRVQLAQLNMMKRHHTPYFHCASHDLNVVLCHACKLPVILAMLEHMRQLGKFCSFPKRIRALEDTIEQHNHELQQDSIDISTLKNILCNSLGRKRENVESQTTEDYHRRSAYLHYIY